MKKHICVVGIISVVLFSPNVFAATTQPSTRESSTTQPFTREPSKGEKEFVVKVVTNEVKDTTEYEKSLRDAAIQGTLSDEMLTNLQKGIAREKQSQTAYCTINNGVYDIPIEVIEYGPPFFFIVKEMQVGKEYLIYGRESGEKNGLRVIEITSLKLIK